MQYLICYTNMNDNTQHFCTTENVDDWLINNPNCHINHMFNANSDLKNIQADREFYFLKNCYAYGLKPDDLNATFYHHQKNRKFILLGIRPQNRKYKFIIKDLNDDKVYKVTKDYITKYSDRIDDTNVTD